MMGERCQRHFTASRQHQARVDGWHGICYKIFVGLGIAQYVSCKTCPVEILVLLTFEAPSGAFYFGHGRPRSELDQC